MWQWIVSVAGLLGFMLIIEESAYYVWNRYIYGKRQRRKRFLRLKRKSQKEVPRGITEDTNSP
ncbi:hypothetical protein HPT25_18360 [Bacillus sp. BRMEA1]|uniref:hypothetical protein n=1 Tax=Neobacillus endophyticus TaxID=2738405 RepID=UPI001566900B|nr:hypothetical protein [Neobacillus endophyticus]NRD79327.1 hypothetical protein [Neobacillus endophyticus]